MPDTCRHCGEEIRMWPTERWRHVVDVMLTCHTPGVWPKTHAEPTYAEPTAKEATDE